MIIKALKVRGMRFELTHPFGRYHLKVVRLPISPPTHPTAKFRSGCKNKAFALDFQSLRNLRPIFFERLAGLRTYFLSTILNVVPFPSSECRTKSCPL